MVIAFIAPSKAGIAADGVGDEIDKETQAPARPRHLRANLKFNPCTAAPTIEIAIKLKRINIFTEAARENEDIEVEIFGSAVVFKILKNYQFANKLIGIASTLSVAVIILLSAQTCNGNCSVIHYCITIEEYRTVAKCFLDAMDKIFNFNFYVLLLQRKFYRIKHKNRYLGRLEDSKIPIIYLIYFRIEFI